MCSIPGFGRAQSHGGRVRSNVPAAVDDAERYSLILGRQFARAERRRCLLRGNCIRAGILWIVRWDYVPPAWSDDLAFGKPSVLVISFSATSQCRSACPSGRPSASHFLSASARILSSVIASAPRLWVTFTNLVLSTEFQREV